MDCSRLMIDSFLKTVDLVLVNGSNKLHNQSHVSIETTSGVKKLNVPIVDSDVVLRCKNVFIVVQNCWDRNSTVYGGGESAQDHVLWCKNKRALIWCRCSAQTPSAKKRLSGCTTTQNTPEGRDLVTDVGLG